MCHLYKLIPKVIQPPLIPPILTSTEEKEIGKRVYKGALPLCIPFFRNFSPPQKVGEGPSESGVPFSRRVGVGGKETRMNE